ncbi:multiprotein-bridging factor 1 family protein [Thermogemmatispora sp.]|uniref:helix-turn-helix domain-containing protein n=1 Tax=Thermogemmatispora sp. TaxID=1968838 RepID=UPI0035E466F1
MSEGTREAPPLKQANQLLKRARELRGWSRQRLALELQQGFPGVAVTAKEIARWERGKRRPSPYYREKLCLIFELTAEQLGFIESSPSAAAMPEPYAAASFPKPLAQPARVITLALSPARQDSELGDLATWLGIKLAQIVRMISSWQGHALACEELQALIDQELAMIDDRLQHDSRQEKLEPIAA